MKAWEQFLLSEPVTVNRYDSKYNAVVTETKENGDEEKTLVNKMPLTDLWTSLSVDLTSCISALNPIEQNQDYDKTATWLEKVDFYNEQLNILMQIAGKLNVIKKSLLPQIHRQNNQEEQEQLAVKRKPSLLNRIMRGRTRQEIKGAKLDPYAFIKDVVARLVSVQQKTLIHLSHTILQCQGGQKPIVAKLKTAFDAVELGDTDCVEKYQAYQHAKDAYNNLFTRIYAGGLTSVTLGVLADAPELVEQGLQQGVDVERMDNFGNTAIIYALYSPTILRELLVRKPSLDGMNHPRGMTLETFFKQDRDKVAATDLPVYDLLKDYMAARNHDHAKFFADIHESHTTHREKIVQLRSRMNKLFSNDMLEQQEFDAERALLTYLHDTHVYNTPYQLIIAEILKYGEVTSEPLAQIVEHARRDVNATLEKINTFSSVFTGKDELTRRIQQDFTFMVQKRLLPFILFCKNFHEMEAAIERSFPEWKANKKATIKKHCLNAQHSSAKVKFSALLNVIKGHYALFTTKKLAEFYLNHMLDVITADSQEKGLTIFNKFIVDFSRVQSKITAESLSQHIIVIGLLLRDLPLTERKDYVNNFRAKIQAEQRLVNDDPDDTSTSSTESSHATDSPRAADSPHDSVASLPPLPPTPPPPSIVVAARDMLSTSVMLVALDLADLGTSSADSSPYSTSEFSEPFSRPASGSTAESSSSDDMGSASTRSSVSDASEVEMQPLTPYAKRVSNTNSLGCAASIAKLMSQCDSGANIMSLLTPIEPVDDDDPELFRYPLRVN